MCNIHVFISGFVFELSCIFVTINEMLPAIWRANLNPRRVSVAFDITHSESRNFWQLSVMKSNMFDQYVYLLLKAIFTYTVNEVFA